MKIRKQIREELNLTQEEMAMLLNVSRSQLALYELGLRELSLMGSIWDGRAGRFLTRLEMSEPKQLPQITALESERNKFIINALKKNEFDLYTCERKIERMEKNYKAALKLFQLTDFTLQSEDQKNPIHLAALETLKAKAVVLFNKNGPHKLIKLEVRQQLLQQETVLLNNFLKASGEVWE